MNQDLTDELNGTGVDPVSKLAFKVIDAVQDGSAAEQVNAVALLFLLVCEHYGVNVRRELERADHIIAEQRRVRNETFRALEAYIEGELK